MGIQCRLAYVCMPKFLINLRYEKEILEHVFYQHIGDMYHYKLRQPY